MKKKRSRRPYGTYAIVSTPIRYLHWPKARYIAMVRACDMLKKAGWKHRPMCPRYKLSPLTARQVEALAEVCHA